jgi:nucleoside-diphosphate-sugar epimerase
LNIAITGITGMVGSHLMKRLFPEGEAKHNVRALIREESVVEHLKPYEDVDYVIGNLDDRDSLAKLVQGMDLVLHLAHFPGPVQTADELIKANVNGSISLLEEAKKAKVKHFVFMSACSIFGEVMPSVDDEHPLDENHPVRPSSLYGSIKASIESFCHFYQKSRAFQVTILRPVTIYGVRPDIDKSEWFKTIDFLATNYNVDVKGSTKYVSVDSVCQALSKVIEQPEEVPNIIHLIDGHIHNMDLAKMIADTIDSFGEVEGVMGEQGVPMSNEMAKSMGVEFQGTEGIVEYIKLVHDLQTKYGGERSIETW